jgi:hypothetical protein
MEMIIKLKPIFQTNRNKIIIRLKSMDVLNQLKRKLKNLSIEYSKKKHNLVYKHKYLKPVK